MATKKLAVEAVHLPHPLLRVLKDLGGEFWPQPEAGRPAEDRAMKALSLKEAAEFLHMNPEVLRRKAKAGIIPAAKPGRSWVFLEEDLVSYVRSQYANRAESAVRVADLTEEEVCHSIAEVRPGGSASRHRTVSEYKEALGLKTG